MAKIAIKPATWKGSSKGPVFEVDVDLDLTRLNRNVDDAQYALDGAIMEHMVNYMPMVTGDFVDLTVAKSESVRGTGIVYAAVGPSGRFLYEGKGMVDEETGSTWARRDARKVLVSQFSGKTRAKEDLTYSRTAHPRAQANWLEPTKKKYLKNWVSIVEHEMVK